MDVQFLFYSGILANHIRPHIYKEFSASMAAVEATITFNTGEKKVFSGPGTDENRQLSLKVVHESVLKIQKDINDALTEVVDKERQEAGDNPASSSRSDEAAGKFCTNLYLMDRYVII